MPKTKRNKLVSLTSVRPKGVQLKKDIIQEVQQYLEQYKYIYVFTYENLKTNRMQSIREKWLPSRFHFGKNKVVAFALGKTAEEEFKENLHKVSQSLTGTRALLFSNEIEKNVKKWFKSYEDEDETVLTLNAVWSDGKFTEID